MMQKNCGFATACEPPAAQNTWRSTDQRQYVQTDGGGGDGLLFDGAS